MSTVPLWRRLVAGAGGLLTAAAFVGGLWGPPPHGAEILVVVTPVVLLVIAAGVIHRPKLGAQLFARAVWWANLVLGALFAFFGARTERGAGTLMTIGCCIALLVAGSKGLGEASERAGYAPAAFKSSLLLLMVLALADAQTFLLFGFVSLQKQAEMALGAVVVAAGGAYVLGFAGLLRLRAWGAWLNIVTCGVLLFAVIVLNADREFRTFVGILCGVHMLAASPLLLTTTMKVRIPSLPPRWRLVATSSIVLGLTLASALSWFSYVRIFG